jgi:hypothetical protein
MEITVKYDLENDNISSFAYTIGKSIEEVINEKSNNLRITNQILESRILSFKHILEEYSIEEPALLNLLIDQYNLLFEITTEKKGKI